MENENNAEYINTHSDILPKSISVHLPHDKRKDVVERLKLMNEISATDPPGEDKFLYTLHLICVVPLVRLLQFVF